ESLERSTLHSASTRPSLQPEDGDALVGCAQARVATQLRHRLQQGQHRVVENGKLLARDEILDDGLLLAQPERLPQPNTQSLALGPFDFPDDQPPRLIEGGQPGLHIESANDVHSSLIRKLGISVAIPQPFPQHFLYFLPLPRGHGSLRPIFGSRTRGFRATELAGGGADGGGTGGSSFGSFLGQESSGWKDAHHSISA